MAEIPATTARVLAAFRDDLLSEGFDPQDVGPLLVEALRHELLTPDGLMLSDV